MRDLAILSEITEQLYVSSQDTVGCLGQCMLCDQLSQVRKENLHISLSRKKLLINSDNNSKTCIVRSVVIGHRHEQIETGKCGKVRTFYVNQYSVSYNIKKMLASGNK